MIFPPFCNELKMAAKCEYFRTFYLSKMAAKFELVHFLKQNKKCGILLDYALA